ncbi:hypothetical protein JOF29_005421 [Kribbella aluminosa]|uniref:Uncharacterized protein n=1 Tax=Kribbella aluminosa TaxID=416017 RepID=A0ABS4URY5_9ACTN|nr:hypothetical protein [Kribbella aluminosa]
MAFDLGGDDRAVGLAFDLGLEGAHDLADAAGAEFGGAGAGDGFGDEGFDLVLGELFGEVLGEDVRLGLLLVGEFGAAGIAVGHDGFAALLRLGAEYVEDLGVAEFAGLLAGHLRLGDRGERHPQRRLADLVARLQGGGHVVVQALLHSGVGHT